MVKAGDDTGPTWFRWTALGRRTDNVLIELWPKVHSTFEMDTAVGAGAADPAFAPDARDGSDIVRCGLPVQHTRAHAGPQVRIVIYDSRFTNYDFKVRTVRKAQSVMPELK